MSLQTNRVNEDSLGERRSWECINILQSFRFEWRF